MVFNGPNAGDSISPGLGTLQQLFITLATLSVTFSVTPMTNTGQSQEGYIEELSTCFYLDTALLKSSESVLSET